MNRRSLLSPRWCHTKDMTSAWNSCIMLLDTFRLLDVDTALINPSKIYIYKFWDANAE